jgi:methylenetetrahydrofolate reductase (NADPH)
MQVPCSFEFFPPKTEAGIHKLKKEQLLLASAKPDFFSVTYGAGGSTRDTTLDAVLSTRRYTGINTAPHLSCIGDEPEDIAQLLKIYQDNGINRLIALRGDLPSGMGLGRGTLKYAADLVRFIREQTGDHFHICVAAYPEVHPESSSGKADLQHFKTKVEAGANSAITQYFYCADAYADFIDRCQTLSIDIPIIPGIMPILNYQKLMRFSTACGADIPRWLSKRLQDLADDEPSLLAFGKDVVGELCQQLLDLDAPGLHFYTLNQAEPCLSIYQSLKGVLA